MAVPSVVSFPGGGGISAITRANRTVFTIESPGKAPARVAVSLDESVALDSNPELKLIGQASTNVLIVTDSYYSRPGSMSYCKAGKEEFLRVLTLGSSPRQTLHVKLQSCRGNIELTEPGVIWNRASGILEINWLGNPSAADPHIYAKYKVAGTGEARLVEERKRDAN